ncbi:MAG: hypothetical protein K1X72_23685 [Pyrinomonadaceae bacterium]|nr:hypothetical protein [Pyrinomonadaceae bacterium]
MELKNLSIAILLFSLIGTANAQIFRMPDAAAQTLYNAWRTKSRTKAKSAAVKSAVEKLFSVRPRVMKFKGCSKREEGDFECIYEDAKNDVTVAMLIENTGRTYIVKSLSFSSES